MTLLLSLKTSVKCCARCQGDHRDLEFKPVDNYEYATHFALCPTNGQPVMLNVEKTRARKKSRHSMEPTPLFDRFWSEYPRKKSKGDAEKAWRQMNGDDNADAILRGVAVAKRSREWLKDNGDFISYPATWLRGMCWLDQPTTAPASAARGIRPPESKFEGRA